MLNFFFSTKVSRAALLLAASMTLLSGCGGGGGGAAGAGTGVIAPTITHTITGTAAYGKPLPIGTVVTVKDSSGAAPIAGLVQDAAGSFSINVTGMAPPLMLMTSGTTMYSILPAFGSTILSSSDNVNITPVTTLVMFELNAGKDPGLAYSSVGFTGWTSKTVIQTTANSVRAALLSKLPTAAAISALNSVPTSVDMMYDPFTANACIAGTAGCTKSPYDTALDSIGTVTAYPSTGSATITPPGAVIAACSALKPCSTVSYAASSAATATVATAASIALSASPPTVKSDGSTTSTITVTALNFANAAIPGITVNMSTDFGILSAASVTTPIGTPLTFTADSSKFNRTATITATAGTVTAQLPVQITGSTVIVGSSGTTLPDDGTAPVTLTITPKDAANSIVPNVTVFLSQTGGTGAVTFTPASGVAVSGVFTSVATGTKAGSVTASISALGVTATTALAVSPAASTFAISGQTLNGAAVAGNPNVTAMKIGDSLAIIVNAPAPAKNVTFATTTGIWNGLTAALTVPVVAGFATATLTTTQAGVATIQVFDQALPATSATLTVGMTSATAASITLQPSPSVLSRSVGTTASTSTLIASVKDALGYPVGGVPVSFSIVNPTGGGETVSPVVVFSAATTAGGLNLGEAHASFTSGSTSTPAGGVQIRASVLGTAVVTEPVGVNLTASGNDATIVIGGTAGSVSFGKATVLAEGGGLTTYIQAMSVLVADANGNPAPLGTVVNLSVWPIAWSTGTACQYDDIVGGFMYGAGNSPLTGTFYNEDVNENLTLDAGEDGARKYYSTGVSVLGGRADGSLTPANSSGGTLPASVSTDASGVATFNLTYPKTSALWITSRIRATTVVQGSSTVGQTAFRLDALAADMTPKCLLGNSPYTF
jgi:hypothetical protein